jgi:maltose phosphorylase
MRNLFDIHEWKIIESEFDPAKTEMAESIFSIGNGSFGQRANFEEDYSGSSLQGSYVGGVYYPDKTRVGWWKNGYPEYFAKVLNACNWIGIRMEVDGNRFDLKHCEIKSFERVLDMRTGTLSRKVRCILPDDKEISIQSTRFCSMADEELAAIRFTIEPLNFSGNVTITPYLDGNVRNTDANYDEFFWEEDVQRVGLQKGVVSCRTKKTGFLVATAMRFSFWENEQLLEIHPNTHVQPFYVDNRFEHYMEKGKRYTIKKYVAITSTINHSEFHVVAESINKVTNAFTTGFDALHQAHKEAWELIWQNADIHIEGDTAAQQAIRFNIFQLYQTYTGKNARLNIGPKGFTGEKYGGATYWDTEAYCLPFYLKTAPPKVARQLLMYRYHQLDKAMENAQKLGFTNGAALYPMVTMNGEECHNEWEITFEEIHRNGAIAFAIYNYYRHTNDWDYVISYGIPVLLAISRFWAQRVHWSENTGEYVMLGVTGPNEYENNINNNWYTNYIARWCLQYSIEVVDRSGQKGLIDQAERAHWNHIIERIRLNKKEGSNIFLQQDGFLDKEILPTSSIPSQQRPINQHWSWDRILRSVYIKQADVLQGIYLFEDHFTEEQIRDNFDFYEPLTVHESSLSPCVHTILAAKLNRMDKAHELYMRTSRLDLDDYNNEVKEGLHITSMAGTWMSIVEGMAGVRVTSSGLAIHPGIPEQWSTYSFRFFFHDQPIFIEIDKNKTLIQHLGQEEMTVEISGQVLKLVPGEKQFVKHIF